MSKLIQLPAIPDPVRGTLVVMETGVQVPFDIPRLFLLSDVPEGAMRGDHAHRQQHQLIVAVHGAFSATSVDREGEQHFMLDRPSIGLQLPPLTWVTLRATAPGSTCLVLTSAHFDEADYIRDRAEFARLIRS